MLWYTSWLETRWRFVIGLVLLICSVSSVVLTYPTVVRRLADAIDPASLEGAGIVGAQVREALELSREFRGYVWWQWFRQNLPQIWTIFAVLLGAGGLVAQSSGAATLFSLSMPVSRRRLLAVRAATALAELLVLAVVPALFVPLLSPAIGEHYGVGDALAFAACVFLGGSVFFSLSFLLSTVFSDVWVPVVIAIVLFYGMSFAEQAAREASSIGLLRVMTAPGYFRAGELPWLGLIGSAVASAAMLYAAGRNVSRRDF